MGKWVTGPPSHFHLLHGLLIIFVCTPVAFARLLSEWGFLASASATGEAPPLVSRFRDLRARRGVCAYVYVLGLPHTHTLTHFLYRFSR